MRPRHELFLWIAAVAFAGIAVVRVRSAGVPFSPETARSLRLPELTKPIPGDSLAALGDEVSENDVFRLARRPTRVAFDSRPAAQPSVPLPVMPNMPIKPVLQLKAIIGGPPWQGVVDGIPGQPPGTLIRIGDKFDRFTVKSIGRDTIVMQSPDSTYRLVLRSDP